MTAATAPAVDACVIIPMHNEAPVISSVVREATAAFRDVVCVDDGSSDASGVLAEREGAWVVRHASNLGQGAALQTGMSFALAKTSARWFVTFDADGQHRPEDALRMVEHARVTGVDVVLGSRFLGTDVPTMPKRRRLLLETGVAFTRATTKMAVTDTHNGLRVLARPAAERIRIRLHGMAHASEILGQVSQLGLSYAEWPVSIRYTEYSLAKGQRSINAVNVLFDLALSKVRAPA